MRHVLLEALHTREGLEGSNSLPLEIRHRHVPVRNRIQARTSENPIPSNLDVYFENACACVCLVDLHPFSPRREKRRHLRQFSTDLVGRLLDNG